ncbi:type IV pilus assembly PilM-like protein [Melghirimyces profundicolus]|uniref:Type IV pilus assembly PilM-like protein n=1 Tax=Melghirimyces profundicolus TaxID=1242148 RepID=A0A2T6BCC6_9BACL|nr:pilus assembly protein PilM [Melghirimyces profundicolus]PTX53684.1 type IV pilus assembly PilM-like protein [Melghirimyces profundicolus]
MPLIPRYALGMELTDSLFKLVEMKRGFKKTRLTQYVVHPLLPFWMKEHSAVDREELIHSISDALAGRRLKTRKVHLALGNRQVVTGIWHIPEMRPNRMRRWIRKKVIPGWDLPFDDPHFDYRPLGPIWEEGDHQQVLVAAVSRSYVEDLTHLIRCCGLEPVSIDLSAFSLQRWVEFTDDSSLHRPATLHLSREGVEVNLFHHGLLQGGTFLPLEMARFLEDGTRPGMDPLAPVLTDPDKVRSYGAALLETLGKEGPEWLNRELWKPNRVWVLTGEGIDLNQLMLWMQSRKTPPLRMGSGPQEWMDEDLQIRSSRWLGTALSVPLGAALSGVRGGST